MIAAESIVYTLSGPRLAQDLLGKGVFFVYTWDGVKVTVSEAEIVEGALVVPYALDLDDESTVIVCPKTEVLLREKGDPCSIEGLAPQTSLLPLYMKLDAPGYLLYREPGEWHKGAKTRRDGQRWRRVSRMVAEWKMNRRCQPGDVVSFENGVRTYCHPDNLKIEHKPPRKPKKKVKFAEPIFRAQRFIRKNNHQVVRVRVDTSRKMLSIRGLEAANLAVNGVFISVDAE